MGEELAVTPQEEEAFDSGFEGTPPAKAEATKTEEPKTEAPKEEDVKPEEVKPPEYVQITREEWDALKSQAAKVDGFEKRIKDTVDGRLGDSEQRIVKKLQAATPSGLSVELPKDVVAEMERDFPELAGHFKTSLERALKGIKGTGPTSAEPDPEAIGKLVTKAVQERELQFLDDAHPTWRDIVGAVADGKPDPKQPFRAWLATKDAAYQKSVNSTDSSTVISRAIDRFIAETATPKTAKPETKPDAKAEARRANLRSSVQPKGDGGQPPPAKNEEDHFADGFRGG